MIMDIIAPGWQASALRSAAIGISEIFWTQIGYLPEERGLYRKMKVRDVILFIAEFKKAYTSSKHSVRLSIG